MVVLKLTHDTGDTKAGTLVGKDRYGNKYYENLKDELPCMFLPEKAQMATGLLDYSADAMGRLQGGLSRVRSVRRPEDAEPPVQS